MINYTKKIFWINFACHFISCKIMAVFNLVEIIKAKVIFNNSLLMNVYQYHK